MPYSARPPGLMSRFRMMTSWPPWAIFWAANIPAGPAPTTKTVFKCVLQQSAGTRIEHALPKCYGRNKLCGQYLIITYHPRPLLAQVAHFLQQSATWDRHKGSGTTVVTIRDRV